MHTNQTAKNKSRKPFYIENSSFVRLFVSLWLMMFLFVIVDVSFYHFLDDYFPEEASDFIEMVELHNSAQGKPFYRRSFCEEGEICLHLLLLTTIQTTLFAAFVFNLKFSNFIKLCLIRLYILHFVYRITPRSLSPPPL